MAKVKDSHIIMVAVTKNNNKLIVHSMLGIVLLAQAGLVDKYTFNFDYLLRFIIKGAILNHNNKTPLEDAVIIFKDTGYEPSLNRMNEVGHSKENGLVDFEFTYFWGEEVEIPFDPPIPIDKVGEDVKYIFNYLKSRPDEKKPKRTFEIIIMKAGYNDKIIPFKEDELMKIDNNIIIDLGTIELLPHSEERK